MRIYLDNAATTPLDSRVFEAMKPLFTEHFGNPSSIHQHGRMVKNLIEESRKIIANVINCSIGEVFFMSSATEANNMALTCSVTDLGIERIISSPTEHHCVLHTLERIKEKFGTEILFLDVDEKGYPDINQLSEALKTSEKKTLVSIMHANNELGTICDIGSISRIAKEYGAIFHCDTVQSMGKYPIDVQQNEINFLSGSGHKFFGPKGSAFIYINNETKIGPIMHGGAQERNMRAGTENTYGIVGLGKALELAVHEMEERKLKINGLRKKTIEGLQIIREDFHFNSDIDKGHYYILNVGFPKTPKTEMINFNLDIAGISASAGSACSSGVESQSHVLQAIKADPGRKAVRFSFSHLNTEDEIDYLLEKIPDII